MRFRAVLIAASANDVRSIGKLRGENTTMSESRCELVEGI